MVGRRRRREVSDRIGGISEDEQVEEVRTGYGAANLDADSDEEAEWDEVVGEATGEETPFGHSMAELEALHYDGGGGDATPAEGEAGIEIGKNETGPINIVLERVKKGKGREKKRTVNSAMERTIRHETHRMHTVCLLVAGLVRNRLLNDPLLQARLLSLVPLRLANAFQSFSPQTHPNERDRSRLFDSALRDLVSWWWQVFEIDDDVEGVKQRTWDEAEALFTLNPSIAMPKKKRDPKGKAKARAIEKDPFAELLEMGEPIHGSKSLMKRAVLQRGTRDVSSQLFTALLRALGIPARLVFSLQPVTWRGASGGGRAVDGGTDDDEGTAETVSSSSPEKGKGRAKANGRAKRTRTAPATSRAAEQSAAAKRKPRGELATKALKAAQAIKVRRVAGGTTSEAHTAGEDESDSDSDGDFEPVEIPGAGVNGTQGDGSSSRPFSLNGSDTDDASRRQSWLSVAPGKASKKAPPVKLRASRPTKPGRQWAKSPSPGPEELSRPPVWWTEVYSRPAREWYAVDVARKRMRCKNIMEPSKSNPENRLLYVIAYEEDHYIRDVTAKYAHSYGATTVKSRLPSRKGMDWFAEAVRPLRRPYRLSRDDKEDMEIERAQTSEAMPTTVTGFKDHPNFALERHLKREEVIYPRRQLGNFRGEIVFPRSSVVSLKSAENYMREGRRVKQGEQALKIVKARVVTINKRREQAAAEAEGLEAAMQGLYADWQTELLIPPPIANGEIPRNSYGNMDLFAPHMLPRGAVHLPYKGIAKIAKQLKISFAEAVTGFEFHKQRAVPVVEGIVVAEEAKEAIWDAFWSSEEAAMEKEMTKVQERCLKRWKKLILGLRIRQRLQEEYRGKLLAAEKQVTKPSEGPSELRNVQRNAAELAAHSAGAAVEQELYADHHVNALTMPKPAKALYTDSGHRRKRAESESTSDSDDPDADVGPMPKAPESRKENRAVKIGTKTASKRVKLVVPAGRRSKRGQ